MAVLSTRDAVTLTDLVLLDGHCHQVSVADLSDEQFASACTESAYGTDATFNSQLGHAIRRWCAPALGLPVHAPMRDYLIARRTLGAAASVAALMRAARLAGLLIDTGLPAADLVTVERMAELADAPAREVVRLETLAESVVDGTDATGFGAAIRDAIHNAYGGGAVAAKSIAAYRHGLDLPPRRPSDTEVRRATGEWLRARAEGHRRLEGHGRLVDPVLLRHLLWCAVDAGRPIQLHTGFGDADADMVRADPARLQPFCAATETTGTPLVLLHCYPYHRNAGWLAHNYPHVYVDVGLAVGFVGARAGAVLAEFLELAPFGKVLYSSDAYRIAELYLVGAAQFRHSLARVLGGFVADGAMLADDADEVARAIGSGNATRLYGVEPSLH